MHSSLVYGMTQRSPEKRQGARGEQTFFQPKSTHPWQDRCLEESNDVGGSYIFHFVGVATIKESELVNHAASDGDITHTKNLIWTCK